MTSPLIGVGLIVLVGAAAILLRRGRPADETVPGPEGAPGEPSEPEDADFDAETATASEPGEPDPESRVLVTADGVALVDVRGHIRMIPMAGDEELAPWLEEATRTGSTPWRLAQVFYRTVGPSARESGTALNAGDFTAARVRRDAEGLWRVETLGRDGEYGYLAFASEDAARPALAMIEHARIVRAAVDADGDPIPPSPEDFEEARRRYEQTERELTLSVDDDEPPRPNDYSNRR